MQRDEPPGVGLPIVPLRLLAANIDMNHPLPSNGRIELQFDRLLQPLSVIRQTFVLEDIGMTTAFTPTIAYDPVARIVTITPLTDVNQVLKPDQTYELIITTPKDRADVNGLRAIDGALLEAPSFRTIAFKVTDPLPSPPTTVSIDFCRDIYPIFSQKCSLSPCHLGPSANDKTTPMTAAGLALDPPSFIAGTALGRVAQGANTGARSVAAAPSLLFGEDMPIIDPTGNPSNSWLMYKILLATPTPDPIVEAGADATEGEPEAGGADAGMFDAGGRDGEAGSDGEASDGGVVKTPPVVIPPIDVSHVHSLPWTTDFSDDRAVLSNYVLGREMPYPGFTAPLTPDQLERVSLWIAEGAAAPAACK